MIEPVFHPSTAQTIAIFRKNLPQSMLLSGPNGIGLVSAARYLGEPDIIEHLLPKDSKDAISPTGTIGVAAIRQLYEQTRSRPAKRQIVVLQNADRMSAGASAAFLKLLEEPTEGTHFILTSHQPHLLPATIRSRLQHLNLQPVTAEQTAQFIEQLGINDPVKKSQLEFLAAGRPAELARLAQNDTYFQEKAKIIGDARDFLQANSYKKMTIIHAYRQDRSRSLELIDAALTILRRSLSTKSNPTLVGQIGALLESRERITGNGSVMLQLAKFVI